MFLNQLKRKLKDPKGHLPSQTILGMNVNETHMLFQTAIQTCEFEHWIEYKTKEI